MEKYAIIVAGGEGTRLGGDLPKQFRDLCGKPLLWWSMKAFHDEDPSTRITLVVHPRHVDDWKKLFSSLPEKDRIPHDVAVGGTSRTGSVKNGLAGIPDVDDALVAVHDAARPLVCAEMIARGWETAAKAGGAVPAVPVTDSLRRLDGDGSVAVDRSLYVAVQTPQVFRVSLLKKAYEKNPETVYSDDASAFEASGLIPALYEGSHLNMKVTNPGDMEIASLFINSCCQSK